jgi:thioredoxin 1
MTQLDPALIKLTKDNRRSILAQDGIVVVECWAASCGACAILDPILCKVADKHQEHTFVRLDILAEEEMTSELGIQHTPTLLLYRDGILLFKQAGNFDEARLEDILGQAESLDMDMVRADIQSQESGDGKTTE